MEGRIKSVLFFAASVVDFDGFSISASANVSRHLRVGNHVAYSPEVLGAS